MKSGKILVVGGYGKVGRIISTTLGNQFPGRVIAAGRNLRKADELSQAMGGKVLPLALDVFDPAVNFDRVLDGVSLVVMCLDQPNTQFVERCLQIGIDYIDITANGDFLAGVEKLNAPAKANGSTAVLSVGLAPGLTNLLARHAKAHLDEVQHLDIFVMLGLGEAHGEAAIRWTIKNLSAEFTVLEYGFEKRVRSFEESRETTFPGIGRRKAYSFNLPDQHVIPRTLELDSVASWLCFDLASMTNLFAWLKKAGALRILRHRGVQDMFVKAFLTFHFGSEAYVAQVNAVGRNNGQPVTYNFSIHGESEAQITGKVAAKVASVLDSTPMPAGVFHIDQLFEPLLFFESIIGNGIEFTAGHEK